MPFTSSSLDRAVRMGLFATAPMNVMGALLFAPPLVFARALFGLPEANPLYLWLISLWVLSFGAAYLRMAIIGPERTFMLVGATGKGIFGLLIVLGVLLGNLPAHAVIAGFPDLVLASLFAAWLGQRRAA